MVEMTYRPLGASGLVVSTVGLGCNAFGLRADIDATREIVQAAIDSGITLFDVADIYGPEPGVSESMLGEVLGDHRDDVVLATKFGMDMRGANGADHGVRGSRRYIRRAVEASLRRLRTDHIDLYQLHQPDPVTPIEETLTALAELVAEGKVRYVGSSNFAGWQVVEADWVARSSGCAAFISAQNKYSMYDRSAEAELIPACEHVGVGLIPFFPLAYGLLAGRYKRGEPAPAGSKLAGSSGRLENADFDRIERFEAYAAERGLTPVQVAIGGLAAQPAVASVIAGASKADQVRTNAEAGQWEPTPEDLVVLDEITAP
uniref:Oxidoreductase n=1 Tax=uncultured Nocardioidaceae bacterium TaxID=253824 RepID=A0A6J4KTQ1_9ACTN|nr:MAG: Oxidoreductase [uncultured Nocardioidaceae bacterium]